MFIFWVLKAQMNVDLFYYYFDFLTVRTDIMKRHSTKNPEGSKAFKTQIPAT